MSHATNPDRPRGETGGVPAAIVIVSGDPGARELLHRELSKRYGTDYQIVVCGRPAEAAPRIKDLRAAGVPVALVVGGVGAADPDGIEVLAAVRAIDPRALRVAAVGWGDWRSVRSAFDAVTLGTLDHWVIGPVQAPAEEFHRSITEFLREWAGQRPGGFEPVRVIGRRWSARSQELRDLFARYRVPAGFYDAASGQGRKMLRDAVARDRQGFIATGPDLPAGTGVRGPAGRPPLSLETSLPGVFAVGDVRRGSVKRVASAVGEGAASIPLVHRHLARAAAARETPHPPAIPASTRPGPAGGPVTAPTPTEHLVIAVPQVRRRS